MITTNNSADILLDSLSDTSFNTLPDNSSKPDTKLNNCMETEADNCLETGAGKCLESETGNCLGTGTDGNFNLDEIQQFLAGGDEGFVDPVFVDHEDSQNAADLDQLVFETEKDNQEENKSYVETHIFLYYFHSAFLLDVIDDFLIIDFNQNIFWFNLVRFDPSC